MKFLVASCLMLFGYAALSQDSLSYLSDPNAYQRERFVDFEHANISVDFVPENGKVNGKVTHTFKVLRQEIDTLYLDGVRMEVENATCDEQPILFEKTDKGITFLFKQPLLFGTSHKLSIQYSCQPKRGLYFIGWDDPSNRSPKQIWTQGQGIDNRHWVPLFDDMADKISTDILIQVPSNMKVLSNGRLVTQMKDNQGNTTWHWQMNKPHSPYLMMLGIGNYDIDTVASNSGVPLYRYMDPKWPERFEWTYRYDKEIFDFLETEIGMDYPWPKYGQIPVQDFPYGAMENTSATVFGDFFCVDSIGFNDANYIYVNGHELAHQWFGDLVTSTSPKHHWLHESFATYYHHLVVKEFVGEYEFQKMMRDNQNAALNGSKKDFKGVGHSQAGSHRHYLKGSHVLKMLRYVLGDDAFRTGLKHYLNTHQYKTVNTEDLIKSFSESSGHSIGGFINQWVYQGGEPHFNVQFETQKKEKTHRFIVEQLQDTTNLVATFKMPVVLEVHYSDKSKDSIRVWLKNSVDTFLLPFEGKKKIEYVLFDPNSEILKSINFERPEDWLLKQAIQSANMIDRFDALLGLQESDSKATTKTLHQVLAGDDFYLVRGEALKQLVQKEELSNAEIISIINGDDIALQKIMINSVKELNPELKNEYVKLLNAPSYDLVQMTLVRLCSSFREDIPTYLEMTQSVYGTKGNNVRVQWLEIDYLTTKNEKSAKELVDMCSNAYDFITRQKAMAALKRIDYCDDDLIKNLVQGIQKANWKLSSSSGKLLKHFYSKSENKDDFTKVVDQIDLSEYQKPRVYRFLD